MEDFNNKILIIAGEVSGDMHGAALITSMLQKRKGLQFVGIGGDNMISSGLEALYHVRDMAFLGFVEVLKHLPFILKVERRILEYVKNNKIKLAVLIDYPGFNLRIAKKLKNLGVKVIYYISPQIWAWHQSRIKKIKSSVEEMLVVFPFEKEFYKKGGVKVEYVGHPLVEKIDKYTFSSKEDFFSKYNIEKDILLLLPGSRKHEIEKHLPEMVKSARIISKQKDLEIVIACSENMTEEYLKTFINDGSVRIIKDETYNLLKHSSFGIIKSGTSTLEAAIIGLPFVVIYSTSKLTYELGKRLVKIDFIAMPNIIAGKSIVKEFIQADIDAKKISNYILTVLNDKDELQNIKDNLNEIKIELGGNGASKNAARIIDKIIDEV